MRILSHINCASKHPHDPIRFAEVRVEDLRTMDNVTASVEDVSNESITTTAQKVTDALKA
jgi:hypothetical protein